MQILHRGTLAWGKRAEGADFVAELRWRGHPPSKKAGKLHLPAVEGMVAEHKQPRLQSLLDEGSVAGDDPRLGKRVDEHVEQEEDCDE